jgi:hypothetical protein
MELLTDVATDGVSDHPLLLQLLLLPGFGDGLPTPSEWAGGGEGVVGAVHTPTCVQVPSTHRQARRQRRRLQSRRRWKWRWRRRRLPRVVLPRGEGELGGVAPGARWLLG